jgi:hypothetical protein
VEWGPILWLTDVEFFSLCTHIVGWRKVASWVSFNSISNHIWRSHFLIDSDWQLVSVHEFGVDITIQTLAPLNTWQLLTILGLAPVLVWYFSWFILRCFLFPKLGFPDLICGFSPSPGSESNQSALFLHQITWLKSYSFSLFESVPMFCNRAFLI